jgi:hypothetical protein
MNQHIHHPSTRSDARTTAHAARLADLLDELARQLTESGTLVETRRLAVLASAVERIAPGAAAALVDHSGSEVSRLRAFAVTARQVDRLSAAERDQLVERLDGAPSWAAAA